MRCLKWDWSRTAREVEQPKFLKKLFATYPSTYSSIPPFTNIPSRPRKFLEKLFSVQNVFRQQNVITLEISQFECRKIENIYSEKVLLLRFLLAFRMPFQTEAQSADSSIYFVTHIASNKFFLSLAVRNAMLGEKEKHEPREGLRSEANFLSVN